jgi:hypothetical protein
LIEGETMSETPRSHRGWSWWYLLLILQCAAALWVPFFNKTEPTLIGLPFFYWYQLLLVVVAAVFTALVYFATEE